MLFTLTLKWLFTLSGKHPHSLRNIVHEVLIRYADSEADQKLAEWPGYWNRLSGEVVESPSVEKFKIWLGCPGQSCCSLPCLNWGVRLDGHKNSLPISAILWFCDSLMSRATQWVTLDHTSEFTWRKVHVCLHQSNSSLRGFSVQSISLPSSLVFGPGLHFYLDKCVYLFGLCPLVRLIHSFQGSIWFRLLHTKCVNLSTLRPEGIFFSTIGLCP